MGLVSHMIGPLSAIHHGILPQSRLAQAGVFYFILPYENRLHILAKASG